MSFLSLLLIAFGLSMDAFAVSITNGISIKNLQNKHAFKIAAFMGVFQGVMPVLGWFAGLGFKDYIESLDHWIALILLAVIGGKMIIEAIKNRNTGVCATGYAVEPEENHNDEILSNKSLFFLAVATSIDALAVGVNFAFLQINIVVSATLIGVITFIVCFIGVKIGKRCGCFLQSKAEIAGGVILILIGLKIFLEHMNIL